MVLPLGILVAICIYTAAYLYIIHILCYFYTIIGTPIPIFSCDVSFISFEESGKTKIIILQYYIQC